MKVKIEGGTFPLKGQANSWIYPITTEEGIFRILFLVPEGQKPEIGDFIEGGVLIKREGLQINPDTSKWKRLLRRLYGNP